MIYYLDSQYGNDKNDGLSRQTAFGSLEKVNSLTFTGGDKLLIKAGTVYEGSLSPKRVRDTGMVYIGRYGVGEKPLINGIDTPPILLENFDEVDIEDIAATNVKGNIGLYVLNTAGGVMKHVHIRNCHISHVNDDRHSYSRAEGGIICGSWSEIEQGPGWFDDLLLEDNEIYDVCRTGILVTGHWGSRTKEDWTYNDYVSDTEGWWPSYGVVIRGNRVERVAGDGIFIVGTVDAVMEWNTLYYINTNPPTDIRVANAGIWPQASNNCLIQFNESAHAFKPERFGDSQGFDVDFDCKDTIIQYNYSHDNGGGLMTQCDREENKNGLYGGTIVRNNLSVNDGNIRGEILLFWGAVHNSLIENNTFVAAKEVERLVDVGILRDAFGYPDGVTIRRNIFICNCQNCKYNFLGAENVKLEENLYWGYRIDPDKLEEGAMYFDPQLVDIDAPRDGMDAIMKFVPQNRDVILSGKTASAGEKDLLGESTEGIAYVGAMLPQK